MRGFNWNVLPARCALGAAALLSLASCSLSLPKPGQNSTTDVGSGSNLVWPAPPEKARYKLASVLVGEETVAGKAAESSILTDVARTIAGIAVGERKRKELIRPTSGLTLQNGSVLVVDAGLKALVRFDFANKEFAIWNQSGPDRGFKSPIAVAEDANGGYLVSDSELARVVRLGRDGKPIGEFGAGQLSRPTGLARDPGSGAIFVADSAQHVVKKFNPSGVLIGTIGGPGKAVGRFNAPTYLSFAEGRLFVSDTLNFRVQSFDANGGDAKAFGQPGLYVGQFTRPKGVAVGGDGRIYVVESRQDHLLVFDPAGKLLLPIDGHGEIGAFYLPSGVWTDAKHNVYLADMFNGRIIVFEELTKLSEG